MSYAMLYDVPADEAMYRQVNAAIGDEKREGETLAHERGAG